MRAAGTGGAGTSTLETTPMTNIPAGDGWRPVPIGGPAGTGLRLAREAATGSGEPTLVGTRGDSGASATGALVGGLALGAAGLTGTVGGGAAHLAGRRGIGLPVAIALGAAALIGGGILLARSAGERTTEYLVHFRSQPDLEGVAPDQVYWTLRAHHEANAPAVERELATLLEEEKVRSFSGIIGSNGFVVDVVNRHRDEVEQRLAAVETVGEIVAATME